MDMAHEVCANIISLITQSEATLYCTQTNSLKSRDLSVNCHYNIDGWFGKVAQMALLHETIDIA
jgi:hypothetical protein